MQELIDDRRGERVGHRAYLQRHLRGVAAARRAFGEALHEALALADLLEPSEERLGIELELVQLRVEAAKQTVWITGCRSWYLDDRGIPAVWPWTFDRFREEMAAPKLPAFELRGGAAEGGARR